MATRKRRRTAQSANAGLIVIGDVTNFSRMAMKDQRRVVEGLWEFIQAKVSDGMEVNGTGDGALVTFWDNDWSHHQVVEFAEKWIDHMAKLPTPAMLRVGLHQGPFQVVEIKGLSRKEIVGTGPNDCARIVSFGDGGHIIATDQFVHGWAQFEGDGVFQHFQPPSKQGIEVFVKHDIPQSIRIFRRNSPSQQPPKRIAHLQQVEDSLNKILREIESLFTKALQAYRKNLTPERVSARVSILAPRGEYLESTKYRFHRTEPTVKGNTHYSINGEGAGPPGKAFVQRQVQILNGLPDFLTDEDAYVQKMISSGLSEDVIRNFGRKSRAFMDIPVGFPESQVDLVVCIDTENPLTVPRHGLELIATNIAEDFREPLALLWRLRVQ